jgi:SAM-dependent methyltransferase
MVDIDAVKKTMISKLKHKILGKSQYGNQDWQKADFDWYLKIHDSNHMLHENFIQYFKGKEGVQTVLEVGCGTGIYPIKYKELFDGKKYTGIDISPANIEYCKRNSGFEFECCDIIKTDLGKTYDLVFSHAVIDHVYDIDTFLAKLVMACKKYAYINSYRGYFPDLKSHKMEWRESDKCYYNNISVPRARSVLLENGLTEKEFVIRPQKSGQTQPNLDNQLVIEITRAV